MKLTKLHIESYKHLENISFDFTYPEGHAKAGQPLEKICIIGQSATGKTNVLELVKESLKGLGKSVIFKGVLSRHTQLQFNGAVVFSYNGSPLEMFGDKVIKDGTIFSYLKEGEGGGGLGNYFIKDGLKALYYSADVISKDAIKIFNQSPLDFIEDDEFETHLNINYSSGNYVYEFQNEANKGLWSSLLTKVINYRKNLLQILSELLDPGKMDKFNSEYTKWSSDNPNPIAKFSEKFNPTLFKLNLEIDLVNTKYPIPIKSKLNDDVIPISGLSTGTKGLLLSMFPMFELDTTDAIILMDEPERSLFPDMQIDLISHYQNIAPSAQFIVATHSPFIAAAFEPEERFILYFDEKGKVALRKGESPIGDDPNDMLSNDFNVDYYNKFGKQAYQDYLELKRKVALETETDAKKKLVLEMARLGDKYNF